MKKPGPAPEQTDAQGIEALYRRPGFLLRRAHQIAVSIFMDEAAEAGVTTTQYGVLVILRYCEGLDQIGVSKKVGLDRSTTGLVIQKLEDAGLIVRKDDPKDRRRKVIVLTAKGERKLESLRDAAKRTEEIELSAFDGDEAAQFLALLSKFVNRFNEVTRAPIIADPPGAGMSAVEPRASSSRTSRKNGVPADLSGGASRSASSRWSGR